MPGPKQQQLTEAQRKKLLAAEAKIIEARKEWARLVREAGISAVARELGITPQALHSRIAAMETSPIPSGLGGASITAPLLTEAVAKKPTRRKRAPTRKRRRG